jgi:hypothetical protein
VGRPNSLGEKVFPCSGGVGGHEAGLVEHVSIRCRVLPAVWVVFGEGDRRKDIVYTISPQGPPLIALRSRSARGIYPDRGCRRLLSIEAGGLVKAKPWRGCARRYWAPVICASPHK